MLLLERSYPPRTAQTAAFVFKGPAKSAIILGSEFSQEPRQVQNLPGAIVPTTNGTATEKAGVLSFVLDGVRTEEVGDLLNREGIAVRAGHHCAQPIHRRFGIESTVRASLALYNTCSDIDALADALLRIQTARPSRKA